MVAAIPKKAKKIWAGVYHPSTGNSSLVEPNGAGIILYSIMNTIRKLELAAVDAAFTHDYTHIATGSPTLTP